MVRSERRFALTIFFVTTLVTLAAIATAALTQPPPSPPPPLLPIVDARTPIQHFVVLMMENHGFDNFFGTYPGVDGIPANVSLPDGQGGTVSPHWINATWTLDLPHDRASMIEDYDGGRNDMFAAVASTWLPSLANVSMGYYDGRQLGFYWSLAANFTLADRYFQSVLGPTMPNRFYSLAGQAGNLTSNDVPSGGIDIPSIFDQMQAAGVTWRYYYVLGLGGSPPPMDFPKLRANPAMTANLVSINGLLTDISAGNLPNVTYVDPEGNLAISEHPPADVTVGEAWSASVINAIEAGPQWASTAVLLTWDENGGFYDHVPPPQVDGFGYGFRVPMILVSPYAKRGFVDHAVLDHTSILRFVADNWGLPYLTPREAGSGNLTSALTISGLATSLSRAPSAPSAIPSVHVGLPSAFLVTTVLVPVASVFPAVDDRRVEGRGRDGAG